MSAVTLPSPSSSADTLRLESPVRAAWRRFRRHPLAIVGVIILGLQVLSAIFAPVLSPHNPYTINLADTLAPPSPAYPLGTDDLGRDVLSRLLYAGRVSLTVGLLSAVLFVGIGTVVGAVAGYFGGIVDTLLMRFVDFLLSIPTIMLLILVSAVVGPAQSQNSGMWQIILIIGGISWSGTARLVRGEFLTQKTRDYCEAARALGYSSARIMFRHILPNAAAPIVVSLTLGVSGALLAEAGLSFLGLGIQPPTPSWGNMLTNAQTYIFTQPMLAVYPGLMIFLASLSINFIGDGLRDALDPGHRSRRSG